MKYGDLNEEIGQPSIYISRSAEDTKEGNGMIKSAED